MNRKFVYFLFLFISLEAFASEPVSKDQRNICAAVVTGIPIITNAKALSAEDLKALFLDLSTYQRAGRLFNNTNNTIYLKNVDNLPKGYVVLVVENPLLGFVNDSPLKDKDLATAIQNYYKQVAVEELLRERLLRFVQYSYYDGKGFRLVFREEHLDEIAIRHLRTAATKAGGRFAAQMAAPDLIKAYAEATQTSESNQRGIFLRPELWMVWGLGPSEDQAAWAARLAYKKMYQVRGGQPTFEGTQIFQQYEEVVADIEKTFKDAKQLAAEVLPWLMNISEKLMTLKDGFFVRNEILIHILRKIKVDRSDFYPTVVRKAVADYFRIDIPAGDDDMIIKLRDLQDLERRLDITVRQMPELRIPPKDAVMKIWGDIRGQGARNLQAVERAILMTSELEDYARKIRALHNEQTRQMEAQDQILKGAFEIEPGSTEYFRTGDEISDYLHVSKFNRKTRFRNLLKGLPATWRLVLGDPQDPQSSTQATVLQKKEIEIRLGLLALRDDRITVVETEKIGIYFEFEPSGETLYLVSNDPDLDLEYIYGKIISLDLYKDEKPKGVIINAQTDHGER